MQSRISYVKGKLDEKKRHTTNEEVKGSPPEKLSKKSLRYTQGNKKKPDPVDASDSELDMKVELRMKKIRNDSNSTK